jgi:hypothetical protein
MMSRVRSNLPGDAAIVRFLRLARQHAALSMELVRLRPIAERRAAERGCDLDALVVGAELMPRRTGGAKAQRGGRRAARVSLAAVEREFGPDWLMHAKGVLNPSSIDAYLHVGSMTRSAYLRLLKATMAIVRDGTTADLPDR